MSWEARRELWTQGLLVLNGDMERERETMRRNGVLRINRDKRWREGEAGEWRTGALTAVGNGLETGRLAGIEVQLNVCDTVHRHSGDCRLKVLIRFVLYIGWDCCGSFLVWIFDLFLSTP